MTNNGPHRTTPGSDDMLGRPTMSLPELGVLMGVSEPVIRERHRCGDLESLGIRVLALGRQYRVVTSTVREVLGIDDAEAGNGTP